MYDLQTLTDIAGKALEAEDKYLISEMAKNPTAYHTCHGGILRFNNERYYQFIVARAFLSAYPYIVNVEFDYRDLILKYPDNPNKWFTYIEMKRWMSSTGEPEIYPICTDLTKLSESKADHNLMMIFSANGRGDAKKQLDWLIGELNNNNLNLSMIWSAPKTFETFNMLGQEAEFWVACCEV